VDTVSPDRSLIHGSPKCRTAIGEPIPIGLITPERNRAKSFGGSNRDSMRRKNKVSAGKYHIVNLRHVIQPNRSVRDVGCHAPRVIKFDDVRLAVIKHYGFDFVLVAHHGEHDGAIQAPR
jgi:hypothetical protein